MPLKELCEKSARRSTAIQAWLTHRWQGLVPLPYFSCDIRHSHDKIGIVDTNLFPGGFNNLCNTFTDTTARKLHEYLQRYYPHASKIALLAENHTRNKFYLENIMRLSQLIEKTGHSCRITMPLDSYPDSKVTIRLDEKDPSKALTIYRPEVISGSASGALRQLQLGEDWSSDLVLSNNDFSSGVPEFVQNLSCPVIPDPRLGWHNRYKSEHFRILAELIDEYAAIIDMDPWLLRPETRLVEGVAEDNLLVLTSAIDEILDATRRKNEQYGISDPPYVFIKNDAGTYGLGIAVVFGSGEIASLNRKQRAKLFAAKGETGRQRFIVQEGILTADTYSDHPIEPVIYGIGTEPIGGFFRVHAAKNRYESLNAPGMSFTCLCLHKLDEPHESYFIDCQQKKELVAVATDLARLASLAAALEAKQLESIV